MTTSTEKTADLLHAVLADFAPVVGAITAEQLHDPTPCAQFDVEQLRRHVLGWLTTFAAGFADAQARRRGRTSTDTKYPPTPRPKCAPQPTSLSTPFAGAPRRGHYGSRTARCPAISHLA